MRNNCPQRDIEQDLDKHLYDKKYFKNALSERIVLFSSDFYNYKNTFGINHAEIKTSCDTNAARYSKK